MEMKYVPLHIKTAILASILAMAALIVGITIMSVSLAQQIRNEQKQLAVLQAENLAEQLSANRYQYNAEILQRLANLVSGSHPDFVTVRVWKLDDGRFIEIATSDDHLLIQFPEKTEDLLRNGVSSTTVIASAENGSESLFRVLSPITEDKQIVGAVEVIEKLDTTFSIAFNYLGKLSAVAMLILILALAAFYLLLRKLFYQPLEILLKGMERVEAGNLSIELELAEKPNEFGKLAANFNSMIKRIWEMTTERERQNELLQKKVREATLELINKNEQLEAANRELFQTTCKMSEMERLVAAGQTAAQFAHEVGTPLNLISGHAQLLQTNLPENSKEAKRLELITQQIKRIENIVREMLDRTRFGVSEQKALDLNDLLQKMFAVIEPTLDRQRVRLISDLSDEKCFIKGDANRLQQVFLNLVKNSLDAMPDGGELHVSTSVERKKVKVRFADTGSGMSEEVKKQIFQPLFTTKKRGKGTGLGLFVVKQILDEHRADISIETAPQMGVKFQIVFPSA